MARRPFYIYVYAYTYMCVYVCVYCAFHFCFVQSPLIEL